MAEKKQAAYRLLTIVFVALAVLTGVEYFVGAVENPSTVFLFILAFAKAALVVYYFMHVYRLWREDGHH